ncbi:MAG: WYL domain-containing protein [Selenomonas sp.]|nr:WYL domain-containing protein [Selenomonas sp.]
MLSSVFSLGAQAVVLAPEALRTEVLHRLQDAAKWYGSEE